MDNPIKINLLGGFEAFRNEGQRLPFSNKKGQAVLGFLAVEADRLQTRETLASLLWGNTGEERARHNLRQSLGKIRQAFGEIILTDGDCLGIDADACTTDVAEFQSLADSNDPDRLRYCLDLFKGDLLASVEPREQEYADWLQNTRNRLRQSACKVALRLSEMYGELARTEEAIQALKDLLALDPGDESGHCQLMRLYARAGRRSEALRQYQRCSEALMQEIGAEPDAQTESLYLELKHRQGSTKEDNTASSTVPTVAVLPFENRSDAETNYFADGIAEDLITALSCFHALAVISRGSSFNYRDGTTPDRTIARELGAQYLVRGSVRRSDQRIRISVQLMDAEAGLQVWGQNYDREMHDVFALQDEITSTVVSTLAGRVEAARLRRARKAPPERLDAHDLVLRGKDHHHRFTREDTKICIEMFEKAIQLDPEYAVAYAWLACGYGLAIVFGLDKASRLVNQSQAAAEKGLELDENESECHRVLAQVQLTKRNLEKSLWHQERALFLNPNDDRILCAQGELLTFVGHADEGEEWIRKSMLLNPYHPERYWTHLARALYHLGRYEEALSVLSNISRPRMDDLIYKVVATHMTGEKLSASKLAKQLREKFSEFQADGFIQSLPYTEQAYADAIANPLLAACKGL